jgi:hypothetical protein
MGVSNQIFSGDFARPGYLFVLVVFLAAGTGCSRDNASQATEAPPTAPTAISAQPNPVADEVKREEPKPESKVPSRYSKWRVGYPPESQDSSVSVIAEVDSDETIPTTSGPRQPLLMVQCANRKLLAYIDAHSMGESVSVDGGRHAVPIQVQYDSQLPRTLLAAQSADYQSFLFPDPKQELISIRKASTLHVSFTQFQASPVEFSFNVSLFEDARNALKEQCPATP